MSPLLALPLAAQVATVAGLVLLLVACLFLAARLIARAAQPYTSSDARELATRLHASEAWHCGCRHCVAWREGQ